MRPLRRGLVGLGGEADPAVPLLLRDSKRLKSRQVKVWNFLLAIVPAKQGGGTIRQPLRTVQL